MLRDAYLAGGGSLLSCLDTSTACRDGSAEEDIHLTPLAPQNTTSQFYFVYIVYTVEVTAPADDTISEIERAEDNNTPTHSWDGWRPSKLVTRSTLVSTTVSWSRRAFGSLIAGT